ncbi:MAG: archease [Nitrospirae bacterium]|nr:archease [Nitrospirota bacterium]
MGDIETLDISGDLGIRVFASTLEDIFITAALGFYSLTTSIDAVAAITTAAISVNEDSTERLLIAWLNELIYLFDTDGFVGRQITIEFLDNHQCSALIKGETFNPDKHGSGYLIKAATYHNLKLEKCESGWRFRV